MKKVPTSTANLKIGEKFFTFFAFLLLALGSAGKVHAFSLPSAPSSTQNLGISKSLNAVIFGNANTNNGGHSQGAVAVRGNWTGSYETKQQDNLSGLVNWNGYTNIGAIVGGQIYNSGNIGIRSIAGSALYNTLGSNGKVEAQRGNAVHSGVNSMVFFSEAEAELRRLQVSLSGLASQAIDTSDRNNINVNAALNSLNGSTKVYNLQASQITGNRTLNFNNLGNTDTVVINVVGKTVDWNWSVNGVNPSQILWNFAGAESINVNSRDFTGSLLAIDAHVIQNRNIDGTLIAKDWTVNGNVELHQFNNQVNIGNAPDLTTMPIPEPSSALLALIGLTFLLRRRR